MASITRASARPLARLLLAGIVVAALSSCRPMNEPESTLFAATNDLRSSEGLPAYAQHDALVDQAREWARWMAARGSLAHSDPKTWPVEWTAVAENVGVADTMDEIVAQLQASPSHRGNLTSTKYTHMAVGTARGKDGRIYAAQLFWRG